MTKWHFRLPTNDDAQAISEIYNHYIAHTDYILDEAPISGREILTRMHDILGQGYYVIAEQPTTKELLGFAYAKPWHARVGFRFSHETSIYLKHDRDVAAYKGLGSELYRQLIQRIEDDGQVKVLIGVIVSDNEASIRLHRKLGFDHIATFPRIAYKFSRWIDVDYWARYLS